MDKPTQNELDLRHELDQKFRALDSSQQAIEQTSHFLSREQRVPPETQTAMAVALWARYLLRVHKSRKVAFVYLANDLIQKSKHKQKKGQTVTLDYCKAFEPHLQEVLTVLFEILGTENVEIQTAILKVIQVWQTRSVYPEAMLAELQQTLMDKSGLTQGNLDGT